MQTTIPRIHAVPLAEGEEVVAIVRRHWFHIALRGAADILLFTFLAALVFVADAFLVQVVGGAQATIALSIYALALVGLVLWMHFFAAWSDHWLDAWIITNKRVIDIEQIGFFRRQVSSFPVERIQDVTYDVAGIIAMWLKFGDVRIQTASISENLVMRQVPYPEEVKEAIMAALGASGADVRGY